eukprot:CAMPEP_0114598754 /NCGR_PEP_ID=MMETSP0125-20121206/21162_1 /TAXON_ID=485358 ORGANISM="Aristerostoma sp., Strain ATCC 50986" /NCGR_SAMPLE_ID=MMETSP0125 /ASSEMBLY_ACC=CAM_ASM_000245 /LENGTH=129 /DNA_ID=CAMNT_0001804877 /DNA_START=246 /DNA_END=631 /DNA_ORIENTATION=-
MVKSKSKFDLGDISPNSGKTPLKLKQMGSSGVGLKAVNSPFKFKNENKDDDDKFNDFLKTFEEEQKSKQFINEGMGLLTLHAHRINQVNNVDKLPKMKFKLPVASLRKNDITYFEDDKNLKIRPLLYDT